jgi:predicted nucleic acid-binding Zn ribbon protein
VQEETRPIKICVVCKRPILPDQRPAVQLKNGEEVHVECWNEYDKTRPEKLD